MQVNMFKVACTVWGRVIGAKVNGFSIPIYSTHGNSGSGQGVGGDCPITNTRDKEKEEEVVVVHGILANLKIRVESLERECARYVITFFYCILFFFMLSLYNFWNSLLGLNCGLLIIHL